MPYQPLKERSFEISPVASGQTSEQLLLTLPCWASVEKVSYFPNGQLIFWNDDKVHLGRDVSLDVHGPAPTGRQVMAAWDDNAASSHRVVSAYDEFQLPVQTQRKQSVLLQGDDLYWKSMSLGEGDTEGDPGGTLRVTFRMSMPEIEEGKAAAQSPGWAALEETFATTPYDAQSKLDELVREDPDFYEGSEYSIYSAIKLLENAFELGPEMRAGFVITEQNWGRIRERNYL